MVFESRMSQVDQSAYAGMTDLPEQGLMHCNWWHFYYRSIRPFLMRLLKVLLLRSRF